MFPNVGFKNLYSPALILEVSIVMMEGSHLDSDECGTFARERWPDWKMSTQSKPVPPGRPRVNVRGPGSTTVTPVSTLVVF